MKKFIILLGTMCAFAFAFVFCGFNTYASEETTTGAVEETTTTEEVEETTSADEVVEETEEDEDILDLGLTDEQVEKLSKWIAENTNEEVANLTITLYASLGVMAFVLIIGLILLVKFGASKIKWNAETQAVVEGVASLVKKAQEDGEASDKALMDEIKKMVSQLIATANDKDAVAQAEASANIDKSVDAIIDTITKM